MLLHVQRDLHPVHSHRTTLDQIDDDDEVDEEEEEDLLAIPLALAVGDAAVADDRRLGRQALS